MGKTNTRVLSNEKIISSLLQHGTIKEAAEAAGTTPRTIYDRMNDREFRSQYMEAKNDIIRKAVFTINTQLAAAVDVVADIMNDRETNPAIRLQAAQVLINNAGKFADRLARDEYQSRNEAKGPFDIEL